MNMNDAESRPLMMAVLDDEADADQHQRFVELLANDAELRREFDELNS